MPVIDEFLEESLGYTLRRSAVNLSFDDQWVQDESTVVNHDQAGEANLARFNVNLDDCYVRSEGVGGSGRARNAISFDRPSECRDLGP